jgi:ubiquinone/menaquinone biosynthesis C-methylase UbiE
MPQINKGLRSVLSISSFYTLFQRLVGANSAYSIFSQNYIRSVVGDRILDIGCGPADILAYLPEVEYVGFDASDKYINTAKKRYGNKGSFIRGLVSANNLEYQSYFNIVLVMGVLHHLSDPEVKHLFELAHTVLKPKGRLICIEPCFVDNQSHCARWIISKDRGQNVRNKEDYLLLASNSFPNISCNIRHDLLRIPYTHVIMECIKD